MRCRNHQVTAGIWRHCQWVWLLQIRHAWKAGGLERVTLPDKAEEVVLFRFTGWISHDSWPKLSAAAWFHNRTKKARRFPAYLPLSARLLEVYKHSDVSIVHLAPLSWGSSSPGSLARWSHASMFSQSVISSFRQMPGWVQYVIWLHAETIDTNAGEADQSEMAMRECCTQHVAF